MNIHKNIRWLFDNKSSLAILSINSLKQTRLKECKTHHNCPHDSVSNDLHCNIKYGVYDINHMQHLLVFKNIHKKY